MPVYEFYCPDCHMIFNFLSRRVNTEKRPGCPKCSRAALERQVSVFAISKGRKESEEGELPDLDEARMEQAMEALAAEAEGMDEDDPRQAARMMRKLYGAMGMDVGPGMEEAIRRMEAGEDPDAVEEAMGDLLEQEDPFSGEGGGKGGRTGLRGFRRRYLKPRVDETLYEL
ncbi:MAG: zinc ribbon domain-containing protein [Proteobacteria bacterium]|nr:zinc ribbon domain-containing protein [Pseudomonadota bacterium]